MFVSYSGSLYVTEVQPTDGPKNYFCVVTLLGTDTTKLAKANTLARTNMGILLLLSGDSSEKYFFTIFFKFTVISRDLMFQLFSVRLSVCFAV